MLVQAKAVGTISPAAGTVNADSFDNTVISGHTALAATPADTDEFLISDAGTIKRIDYSYIKSTNTPAFEAHLSADQSISDNTVTKAQFNTERFDTNSDYDNSSNYRFTPTVAGKYFVYANLQLQTGDYKIYVATTYIYKNGSAYALSNTTSADNTIFAHPVTINATIDMNGSSDYIEIYGLLAGHGGSGQHFESSNKNSYFGAFKLA